MEEHLFDLTSDPSESNDLKAERSEDFRRLRQLYDDWEQRVRRDRRGNPGGVRLQASEESKKKKGNQRVS